MIILSALPAFIAHRRGRNFNVWWAYGYALLPLATVHALLLEPTIEAKVRYGKYKLCPNCQELLPDEVIVCKYCGYLYIDSEKRTETNKAEEREDLAKVS